MARRLIDRVAAWRLGGIKAADLDEEIRFHLAEEAENSRRARRRRRPRAARRTSAMSADPRGLGKPGAGARPSAMQDLRYGCAR